MPVSGIDESRFERARLGDIELAWTEADLEPGAVRDRSLPPLVLVHGYTGHRDDWIEVLPELAKSRRTIAIDLRGHGDSQSPTEPSAYSFECFVNDLLALLDHLGIDRCDLLGHSFGGMVVLRFALAHPQRIRSLILMSTAPEVPRTLGRDAWSKACEIAQAQGIVFLQELVEKLGRTRGDPALVGWGERYWLHHRRRLGSMRPESYFGAGRTLFDSDSLVARLGEIELPTLILVGDGDADFLPGAALFEAHLPLARRVTLAGCGHHPQQENTSAWLETLDRFCRDPAAYISA